MGPSSQNCPENRATTNFVMPVKTGIQAGVTWLAGFAEITDIP
jgi:hypothetical protein